MFKKTLNLLYVTSKNGEIRMPNLTNWNGNNVVSFKTNCNKTRLQIAEEIKAKAINDRCKIVLVDVYGTHIRNFELAKNLSISLEQFSYLSVISGLGGQVNFKDDIITVPRYAEFSSIISAAKTCSIEANLAF